MNRNPSSRGSILYIIGISLIAALGGFLFGFDMTVVSGTVPFLKYFFHLDAAGLGWAVSSCILACVFGAAAAGKLADAFGRKNVLIVTACSLPYPPSGRAGRRPSTASSSSACWVGWRSEQRQG